MSEHTVGSKSTSLGNLLLEWFLRLFAVGAYLLVLWAVATNWLLDTHRYSLLLLLLSEGFTLGLIVFARRASRRDCSPLAVLATFYTTTFFLFLEQGNTVQLIPEWGAGVLQTCGLALQLYAKATMGRAFGVLPAARRLVTDGPYRFVRHPMYLAYLVGELGFLLANASIRNLLLISALLLTHVLRMLREEAVLSSSEFSSAYRAYKDRVRFRLLPAVF